MANLQGIRIYRERSTSGSEESYATKDVSSLAVIAPWRVTARVRIFALAPTSNQSTQVRLVVQYGGASDDNYHLFILESQTDSLVDRIRTFHNATDRSGNNGVTGNNSITAITQEDWVWMEIECDADRNLSFKTKDDNTTTRPTTWDNDLTRATKANATPTQEIQSIEVTARVSLNSSGTTRSIFEVDEIYVTQD